MPYSALSGVMTGDVAERTLLSSYRFVFAMIAQLIQSLLNWGLGGAAAFILLVVTLAIYALQVRFLGGSQVAQGAR